MGEMADFFLESVYEAEEERGLFRSGRMSNSEAYDKGIVDEAGFEIGSSNTNKKCKDKLHSKRSKKGNENK